MGVTATLKSTQAWERMEQIMLAQGRKWFWLSGQMGISDETLRVMRRDRREPADSQKRTIAQALSVPVESIWR